VATLTFGAVFAYADQVQADSDYLTGNVQNNPITVNLAPGGTTSVTAGVVIKSQGSTHVVFPVSITPSTENISGSTVGSPADSTLSVSAYDDAGEQHTSFNVTAPAAEDLVCGQNNLFQAKLHFTATTDLTALNGGNETDFVIANVNVEGPDCPSTTNSAPVIDTLGTFSGNEGSDIALTATAHDPDGDPLTYSWAVDTTGGDSGISCPITDADNTNAAASVKCNDDSNAGTFKVTLSVSDDHGHTTAQDSTLDAENVAPSFNSGKPAFAATTVTCASNNVTLNFAYTDRGSNDTQTASIDWGDGNTSNLTAAQTATGSASHTYNSGGPYNATVNVTDDDNGSTGDTNSTNSLVVQYNLSGILQPINDTRNGQAESLFKYGSTIPVKVEVTDCSLSHPSDLVLKVTWKQGTGQTPPGVEEVVPTSQADLGNTMRFSDPLYVLQLNSKATTGDSTSGITIFVTIQLTSQTVQANIGFKK